MNWEHPIRIFKCNFLFFFSSQTFKTDIWYTLTQHGPFGFFSSIFRPQTKKSGNKILNPRILAFQEFRRGPYFDLFATLFFPSKTKEVIFQRYESFRFANRYSSKWIATPSWWQTVIKLSIQIITYCHISTVLSTVLQCFADDLFSTLKNNVQRV